MLACLLGESSDIFFPKLDESQMMTFSDIAELFLKEIGLEPEYCESEQEAKVIAQKWDSINGSYPVYFFKTDTSGEKSFEEFYTKSDKLDMTSYAALGVVKGSEVPAKEDITKTLEEFTALFDSENVDKAKVVSLISKYLPDFNHIETGKSLDQKM
jgi:hypothetical protein